MVGSGQTTGDDEMSDSLGLSIGMTNLVAARIGRPPVMRRSVLTLFNDRAPEVGVPSREPEPQPAAAWC